jgi:hypothetical protein
MTETVEVPFEELVNAVAALRISVNTALTVKPHLTEPCRDDKRWTPWTRWIDPSARLAFDAKHALLKSLPPEVARAVSDAASHVHAIPRTVDDAPF